jgi:hypothetical protein
MDVDEHELRRHLDEVHRQMLERDNVYRVHEEEIRNRDRQIEQLREELAKAEDWARELEGNQLAVQELESTRTFRLAAWVRRLRGRS